MEDEDNIDRLIRIDKELMNIQDKLKLMGYWDMMAHIDIVREKIIRELEEIY